MSFTSTPLGHGRRLDHNTFHGKQPLDGFRPPSPKSLVPTSYAHGAPGPSSRSPTKPLSRERTRTSTDQITDDNDSALNRFAKIKEREQALASRPNSLDSLHPEKWPVKDTSVNIASAFHQAAAGMSYSNPNSAWASGSTRPNAVPRSTSTEYENASQASATRRLAAPPSRVNNRNPIRKPLGQTTSSQTVPDSEEEGTARPNGRGKSPFDSLKAIASNVASYYAKEPLPAVSEEVRETTPEDPSYSYRDEQASFDTRNLTTANQSVANQSTSSISASKKQKHRARQSVDNKAYKPTSDDEASSEYDSDDDGKTKRRKKKIKGVGGPLSTLPVLTADKRRKRKGKSKTTGGAEEDDSESDNGSSNRASVSARGTTRASAPHSIHEAAPHAETSLSDNTPDFVDPLSGEESTMDIPDGFSEPSPRLSGYLGKLVFSVFTFIRNLSIGFLYLIGRTAGVIVDLVVLRPLRWGIHAKNSQMAPMLTYLLGGLVLLTALLYLQEPLRNSIPRRTYIPEAPPENIDALTTRLLKLENLLQGILVDVERTKTKVDHEVRSRVDVDGRVGSLETRLQKETSRLIEAQASSQDSASKSIQAVGDRLHTLQAELAAIQHNGIPSKPSGNTHNNDEIARAKLEALEARIGSVEGGLKDAVGGIKSSGKTVSSVAAWWDKYATTKKGVVVKAADGTDVTALIGRMVETAVSVHNKDTIGRADFALASGGGQVIPSLTSPSYERKPQGLQGYAIHYLTGRGHATGHSPVMALHHDLQNGQCWPFAGTHGQLGVMLAAPALISHITIDHISSEVTWDIRSAPRDMEVWALVEGQDNIAKIREMRAQQAALAQERGETPEPVDYPQTLPKHPEYIRIAAFRYNVHSKDNIQTFPVLPEIENLGVDFGIIALRIINNWGRKEYTCVYRLRVHGQRLGEVPEPLPADYGLEAQS